MLNFNDWSKKDKEIKGYTLTKSSSGLPLFVLDCPIDPDHSVACPDKTYVDLNNEPVKQNNSIVNMVSDYITRHF